MRYYRFNCSAWIDEVIFVVEIDNFSWTKRLLVLSWFAKSKKCLVWLHYVCRQAAEYLLSITEHNQKEGVVKSAELPEIWLMGIKVCCSVNTERGQLLIYIYSWQSIDHIWMFSSLHMYYTGPRRFNDALISNQKDINRRR